MHPSRTPSQMGLSSDLLPPPSTTHARQELGIQEQILCSTLSIDSVIMELLCPWTIYYAPVYQSINFQRTSQWWMFIGQWPFKCQPVPMTASHVTWCKDQGQEGDFGHSGVTPGHRVIKVSVTSRLPSWGIRK